MAVFEYRGLVSATGKQVHGVRDADNAKVLRAALRREGILLTSAAEGTQERKGRRLDDFLALFRRVSVTDVAMMTRQLATLVGAGIPLVESVAALTDQVDKLALKKVLTQVRDRLNEGSSFAKSLEPHPEIFPSLYVNMVAAGEASGTLEKVLERLADFMEGQARLRGKVSAALAYPILMLIIGSVLITVMMVAVVPKVTSIFASLDRALPWYTSLLIFISNVVASAEMRGAVLALASVVCCQRAISLARGGKDTHMMLAVAAIFTIGLLVLPRTAGKAASGADRRIGWVIGAVVTSVALVLAAFSVDSLFEYAIGIGAGIVIALVLARLLTYIATPEGKVRKDGILLNLPIFGGLFRMLAVSRFARTLATLLQSGVPLLKALEIVKNVIGNARIERVVEEAAVSIREGATIAQPLKRSGVFPPMVTHMIAVGEKSGQLESMLENVAKAYDTQVDTKVQALTSLLEPLMIVFMGGAVGFIAFSILMPLIQMNDFVQ